MKRDHVNDISIGPDRWIKFISVDGRQERAIEIDDWTSSLEEFFSSLETECVAECCGVGAFCFWPESIHFAAQGKCIPALYSHLVELQNRVRTAEGGVFVSGRLNNYFDREVLLRLIGHLQLHVQAGLSVNESGENPFSTRFIRPGAIEYLFPEAANTSQLVDALVSNNWRGEIIGPHGSGKSTLLATLLPLVEARGRRIHRVDLHDGQRWLPRGWQARMSDSPTLLVIDGYEQLGHLERWRVRRGMKGPRRGLLVTAHESVGLPRLWTTTVDVDRAQALLARLLPPGCSSISAADLLAALDRHPSDLRSAWFELYDLYEQRRRPANPST